MFPLPPLKTFEYQEILVRYSEKIPELFQKLSSEERVFVYYLFRAAIPGDRILADQLSRFSIELIELFTKLHQYLEKNQHHTNKQFQKECEIYLAYLLCNHSPYFLAENGKNKKTPSSLKFSHLTISNLTAVCQEAKILFNETTQTILKQVFDPEFEPACTQPGSIEGSASNFYSRDFTEEDYNKLPVQDQSRINSYLDKSSDGQVKSLIYCTKSKYGKELEVTVYWLRQASLWAEKFPQYFDSHLVKSLWLLIEFFEKGDESIFKQHCVEWLKSRSPNLDYCAGFQETYDDPKSYRGSYQFEVTTKVLNMNQIEALIPILESKLPFPPEFKKERKEGDLLLNTSINVRLFGTGHLGGFSFTSAYCLPNYVEIKEQVGSKQVIYPSQRSTAMMLNPELNKKLLYSEREREWHDKFDPEYELEDDLRNLLTILHETIGHASGKSTTHRLSEGDPVPLSCKIGDEIPVTSENCPFLLRGTHDAIEEMRAEIIALYVATHHLEELLGIGLLDKWTKKMSVERIKEELILDMARQGFFRYLEQPEDSKEISGAHSLANATIFHYLVEYNAIQVDLEVIRHEGKERFVPVIQLGKVGIDTTMNLIKLLMWEIQRIKSTADGQAAEILLERYGKKIMFPKERKYLLENRNLVTGDTKWTAQLYPIYYPILDKEGQIIDVGLHWPRDLFAQHEELDSLINCL